MNSKEQKRTFAGVKHEMSFSEFTGRFFGGKI